MSDKTKKKSKKTVSWRIELDIIAVVREMASSEDRSISAVVGRLISKGIESELKSK